jgi:hypothetical protein
VVDRIAAGIGDARIIADVVVYLGVVIGTGALRPLEMYRIAAEAVRAKRRGRAPESTQPCAGQRA